MRAAFMLIGYEAQDNYSGVTHIHFRYPCEFETKSTLSMVQLSSSRTSLKPENMGILALQTFLSCISLQLGHTKLACLILAQFAYSAAAVVCLFTVEKECASPDKTQEE